MIGLAGELCGKFVWFQSFCQTSTFEIYPRQDEFCRLMATEVKFKYPQPFTWAQVMDLDVGTISQGTQLTSLMELPIH